MYDCNITIVDAEGGNALKTYEDGSSAYLYNLYIYAESEFAHGIYTAGGYIYASDLNVTTYGTSSSAIATDTGGGIIEVYDSTANTYGLKSALLYSTGNITASNLQGTSNRSPACVIDGSNNWTLSNSAVSASPEEHGVFQTMSTVSSNDTSTEALAWVIGGSVAESGGTYGLIFASNIIFNIYLDDVDISISSGILANSSADDWGTSGSNGGTLNVHLTDIDVTGDVYVDSISAVSITLESSTWSGAINSNDTDGDAGVILDSDSTWTVTGDSYLTILVDGDDTLSNIESDRYTVYYESSSNSWLDNSTYSLSGGGSLIPS
ncbi:hypothetical protein UCRPC4_g01980 [Phaeomoniella chlamydospora]|uniref:Uncharacterized protein n=1 Tax=Phaeomoniella chlamydospora TaxID=158046 RepID=A0A0G2ESH2_PHACM|nr:hypothetical protein UCRPC4_g01980 [Phaeomoniella chlamydospora]